MPHEKKIKKKKEKIKGYRDQDNRPPESMERGDD